MVRKITHSEAQIANTLDVLFDIFVFHNREGRSLDIGDCGDVEGKSILYQVWRKASEKRFGILVISGPDHGPDATILRRLPERN